MSTFRKPTLRACEKAIGSPAAKWKGRCFEIASKLVQAKLVPGAAVYGHYRGRVHEDSFFADKCSFGFVQHGWVILPDQRVFDPTRWVFEAVKPYLFVGAADDYDEGGNKLRSRMIGPPPPYDVDEDRFEFTQEMLSGEAWTHAEKLLKPDYCAQDPGILSTSQVQWLAHVAFDQLQPYAFDIYRAIKEVGRGACIPIDNLRHAERLRGEKL